MKITRTSHGAYHKVLMVISLGLVVLMAAGLSKLELTSDYKIFFEEGDSKAALLEVIQSTYAESDTIFIMIEPPQEEGIYTLDTLQLMHELTGDLWKSAYVSRVDSITNFPFSYAVGDDIFIEEFIPDESYLTPERIQFVATNAPQEQDLLNHLVTKKGERAAINATVRLKGDNRKQEILDAVEGAERLIAKYEKAYPQHQLYMTGIVPMNAAFFRAAKGDFLTLIPLMMLVVISAIGLIIRSLGATLSIFGMVLMVFAASLGGAAWGGIQLSAPSISAPIIVFTVLVASLVHLINHIKRKIIDGVPQHDAIADAYAEHSKPVILSHVTTLIGFLSMNMSDSPPFRDLGNIVAIGVAVSLLLTFTVLPFILRVISISSHESVVYSKLQKVAQLAPFVSKYQNVLLLTLLPLSALLLYFATHNSLNDNLVKYFDESVQFRSDTDEIDHYFSGICNIDFSFKNSAVNGIFDPKFLAFINEFERWVIQDTQVHSSSSPLWQMSKIHGLLAGKKRYTLPINPDDAAQEFLFYEMSLPFGKEANNVVSFDKTQMKVSVRLHTLSADQLIEFEQRALDWLQQNNMNTYEVQHSSPSLVFSHIGQDSIRSLLLGASTAFILITMVIMIVFRSLKLGIISLIPNVLPISCAFGVWYFLNGQISMGLAGVTAMVIGIIVDDTVHILHQYVNGMKKNLSPHAALVATFESAGVAIVTSSILLIIGFSFLMLSSFEKNAQVGTLAVTTIIFALIFDLFLLPALLLKLSRRAQQFSASDVHFTPN